MNKKLKIRRNIIFIIFFGWMCFSAHSENRIQPVVPRMNYNAPLEIPDQVLHGAGQQSPVAFRNYIKVLKPSGNFPVLYMDYIFLQGDVRTDMKRIKTLCDEANENGLYIIPQIGIGMAWDGKPELHYEHDVASGKYDREIDYLCRGIIGLGHPVFLRIGFEFNGKDWNGYLPGPYKKAFIRITQKVRESGCEAATVWCASAADGTMNHYMDYYPGDEFVDWWGIDLFLPKEFTLAKTISFMKDAANHKKPVMIGETTPKKIGVPGGEKSWRQWFEPYFNFIHAHSNVKATCYINWNWTEHAQWADWGDARLEANTLVADLFSQEMDDPVFFHARDEKGLRKAYGVNDTSSPGKVKDVSAVFDRNAVFLNWQPASDNVKVLRYEIFRNNTLIDIINNNTYRDTDIHASQIYFYSVKAVDAGGNPGDAEVAEKVGIPGSIEKVSDGDFESENNEWITKAFFAGKLIFSRSTTNPLDGRFSARLFVEKAAGVNWHVQFGQNFSSCQNMEYTLSFLIRADENTSIELFLQQTHEPYASIIHESITAGKKPKYYSFKNTEPAKADSLFLAFMLGNANKRTIYVDDVSLIESAGK